MCPRTRNYVVKNLKFRTQERKPYLSKYKCNKDTCKVGKITTQVLSCYKILQTHIISVNM